MKLRPSVASVIRDHVTMELESIDRMYLNIFVPQLQREGGVAAFFRKTASFSYRSPVTLDIHMPLGIRPRQKATIHIRDLELSERSRSRNQINSDWAIML